jgi:flagellar protein FlgJ
MDVSGIISTADSRAAMMQHTRQEAEISRFREILQSALDQTEGREAADRAQIRKAAEMFEAYFLQLMFREMRRTNFDEDGFIPRSNAERIFTEMLDETIADAAATQGGFGLADMLYMQMTRGL